MPGVPGELIVTVEAEVIPGDPPPDDTTEETS